MGNGITELDEPLQPPWVWYVLSFIIPTLGVVLGALFLGRKGEKSKRFGRNCLITAASAIAIIVGCLVLYVGAVISIAFLAIKNGGA